MSPQSRRHAIRAAFASMVTAGAALSQRKDVPVPAKDNLKITKLETILVKPRWLFLKIHTNAGIIGLGEPLVEGRALTVATAIQEIAPYLIGKDPRPVAHHWQAIYRHAFYRGGPVLTSALSGIDQALWDIKGKALGVPVYELLGGPPAIRSASTPTRARRKQCAPKWPKASPRSKPDRLGVTRKLSPVAITSIDTSSHQLKWITSSRNLLSYARL